MEVSRRGLLPRCCGFSADLPPLSHLPPQVAGYRMHLAYRGQFAKLLHYITDQFLPALATSNDPDARAVYTR